MDNQKGNTENLPYTSPVVNEMPIIASHPIVSSMDITEDIFDDMAACGFNTMLYFGSSNILNKLIGKRKDSEDSFYDFTEGMLDGKGLKVIVSHESLMNEETWKTIINRYTGNPLVCGWFIQPAPKFQILVDYSSRMSQINDATRGELVFCQLSEILSKDYTNGCESYIEYLRLVDDSIHPAVWLTTANPFRIVDGHVKTDLNLLYMNMEGLSAMSNTTGRPMWAYCHTTAMKSASVERPAPTEEMLRFEVFTELAYGAQGILYSMYSLYHSSATISYYTALVNRANEKFPAWYLAKKINSEIRRYSNVFVGSMLEQCRHTGTNKYKDTVMLGNDTIGPLLSVNGPDTGVLISHLKTPSKDADNKDGFDNYLIIVNHSVTEYQELTLNFKMSLYFSEITPCPITGNAAAIQSNTLAKASTPVVPSFTLHRTLLPGGYLIFKFK